MNTFELCEPSQLNANIKVGLVEGQLLRGQFAAASCRETLFLS